MGYKIPTSINCGYLTVPAFLAEYITNYYGFTKGEGELHSAFIGMNTSEPFEEIKLELTGSLPECVRLLTNCQIPYHYNYTFAEDMEIDYWYLLEADNDELIGANSTDPNWINMQPKLDLPSLNKRLDTIKAQYKLLGHSVKDLLEVREILNYDFDD